MDPALQEFLKSLTPLVTAIVGVLISWLVARSMKNQAEGKFAEKSREAEIEAERQKTEREAQFDKTVEFFRSEFGKALRKSEELEKDIEALNGNLKKEQERNDELEREIKAVKYDQRTQEGEIRSLKQQNSSQVEEIHRLTNLLNDRNKAFDGQAIELDKMRQTVAKLETDVQNLQTANQKLTADNAAKDLQLSQRANEVTALKEQIQGMQDRLNALEHPPTPPEPPTIADSKE